MTKVVDRKPGAEGRTRNEPWASAIPVKFCVGVVVTSADGALRVVAGDVEADVRRAASCLLVPEAGDTVVCAQLAPAELWVLSVLEREAGSTRVLHSQGPTQLLVEGGEFELTSEAIALKSERFLLASPQAEVINDDLTFVGQKVRMVAGAVRVVGATLSTVFDRVTAFSKQYLRTTDGLDRVNADHVELEAEQLLRVSGEHALIDGEKLVKARGGQIHFG